MYQFLNSILNNKNIVFFAVLFFVMVGFGSSVSAETCTSDARCHSVLAGATCVTNPSHANFGNCVFGNANGCTNSAVCASYVPGATCYLFYCYFIAPSGEGGVGGGVGRACIPDGTPCPTGLVCTSDFWSNLTYGTCQPPQPPSPPCSGYITTPFCYATKAAAAAVGSAALGLDLIVKYLLNWIISTVLYTPITSASVVATGWPIVRNFANAIIVLALIAIAMATILRIKDYEAKSLLPKLIIAALLINFSLVICGIIIDAASITIRFFNPPRTTGQGH